MGETRRAVVLMSQLRWEREVTTGPHPHESDQELGDCRFSKLWLAFISCGSYCERGIGS